MIRATALALLLATPALAQQSDGGAAQVTLLSGWQRPDGARMAAIEMRLAPGWHTYWRVPGESGIPPEFDWSRSRNLASVAYQWPRPQVFRGGYDTTIGYTGTLTLPILLTPKDPRQPIDLALDMTFGTCSEICMAGSADLSLTIPPGAPTQGAPAIRAALAQRPLGAAEAGVTAVTCGLAPAPRGYDLTTNVTFATPPAAAQTMVIEPDSPEVWIDLPETTTNGRQIHAHASLQPPRGAPGPMIERGALRITLIDADRAIDIEGCDAATAPHDLPDAILSSSGDLTPDH